MRVSEEYQNEERFVKISLALLLKIDNSVSLTLRQTGRAVTRGYRDYLYYSRPEVLKKDLEYRSVLLGENVEYTPWQGFHVDYNRRSRVE